MGLRAWVLPTGESPPLAPLNKGHLASRPNFSGHLGISLAAFFLVLENITHKLPKASDSALMLIGHATLQRANNVQRERRAHHSGVKIKMKAKAAKEGKNLMPWMAAG